MPNWNDVVRAANDGNPKPPRRVEKSNEEWQNLLTPDQYFVMRQHGTESPFSSEMCTLFEPGIYACGSCGTELFDSASKFDSKTGWPSFGEALSSDVVAYKADDSHGMRRIEAICNVCDAHLGHVFPDGPAPSGLRFCINALSLNKVKSEG